MMCSHSIGTLVGYDMMASPITIRQAEKIQNNIKTKREHYESIHIVILVLLEIFYSKR